MDLIETQKKYLRTQFLSKRLQLSAQEQEEKSNQLTFEILKLPEFLSCHHIAAYWPNKGEMSPLPLLKAAQKMGKICYLPRLGANMCLDFVAYRPEITPLTPNHYGIPEPKADPKRTVLAPNLDLVLLPLLAFDEQGNRLGRGGGYYDKTFAFVKLSTTVKKPFLLGIGFELQCIKALPCDDWDIPLDGVMTEKRLLRFSKFL